MKNLINLGLVVISTVLILSPQLVCGAEKNQVLTVSMNKVMRSLSVSDLLKSKHYQKLKLISDSHFPNGITYSVVPIRDVFQGFTFPENAIIQFTALDGFSGIIEAKRLLESAPGKSRAYLAFDLPKAAEKFGPFYIVWTNPKASHISTEEWPYAVVSLEVKSSLETLYPHLQPDAKLSKTDSVRLGYEVFLKNCFSCHTLNYEGTSHLGPDLNMPFNPTEYFKDDFFARYVRNPQSLRYFPENKMNAFSKEIISDSELTDLIHYLSDMAKRKVKIKN
jgi:mono/diheme cytochrome c family protein